MSAAGMIKMISMNDDDDVILSLVSLLDFFFSPFIKLTRPASALFLPFCSEQSCRLSWNGISRA